MTNNIVEQLNSTESKQKALQNRKENMTPFFLLNKFTKKKRSINNRIEKLIEEKRDIQDRIDNLLSSSGISSYPNKITGVKLTRLQQIVNILKEKGSTSIVDAANALNTNAQNVYQVIYRNKGKVFSKNGNLWSLVDKS